MENASLKLELMILNQEPAAFKVNEEEAKKWIANGAKPTDTVARLFK